MDGGSELSDVEDLFVGGEARLPETVNFDSLPSQEGVRVHNITHLPCRHWRTHCVKKGKAKRRAHRKKGPGRGEG